MIIVIVTVMMTMMMIIVIIIIINGRLSAHSLNFYNYHRNVLGTKCLAEILSERYYNHWIRQQLKMIMWRIISWIYRYYDEVSRFLLILLGK